MRNFQKSVDLFPEQFYCSSSAKLTLKGNICIVFCPHSCLVGLMYFIKLRIKKPTFFVLILHILYICNEIIRGISDGFHKDGLSTPKQRLSHIFFISLNGDFIED